MIGARQAGTWANKSAPEPMDYFDIKGVVDALVEALHVQNVEISRASHSSFHPGRSQC